MSTRMALRRVRSPLLGWAFVFSAREAAAALRPAADQAATIARLFDVFLIVCTSVFVLVLGFLVAALMRRRSDLSRTAGRGVAIALVVSFLILVGLFLSSLSAGAELAKLPEPELEIEVWGHRWWWEIRYKDPVPSYEFTTANEIHIPAGKRVSLRLRSFDVIHSFWVPALHGKRDLIPGYDTTIIIRASTPGVYQGQCAEYCGMQHAHMRLRVFVDPPEVFEAWARSQQQPAKAPVTESQKRGQEVFLRNQCAFCHTIVGTPAGGKTAPDLTHLASRKKIAGDSFPNRRGYLAGWILDPQNLKPGTQMPPTPLESEELESLLDYLESLK